MLNYNPGKDFLSLLISSDVWAIISEHFGKNDAQQMTFMLANINKKVERERIPISGIYFFEAGNITAAGFSKIFSLPSITEVNLFKCTQFTSSKDCFNALRQLTKLESLTFSGVSFGRQYRGIWQDLSTLTNLRTMSIDHNSIFESKYVAKLKHLSSLSLSVLNPINHLWDRPTYHLFNAVDLPSLTALKIDYTVHPCQGLDTITTLTNLDIGNNEDLKVTDFPTSVTHLRMQQRLNFDLTRFTRLQSIVLRLSVTTWKVQKNYEENFLQQVIEQYGLHKLPFLAYIEILGYIDKTRDKTALSIYFSQLLVKAIEQLKRDSKLKVVFS